MKLKAHPLAKVFLVAEEFAMARVQLVEAMQRHTPHRIASWRRGSTSLWEKVEKVMYDASNGQFRGMKPYSSRRNFRNFVTKVLVGAKKICEASDGVPPKLLPDFNAIAIKYEEVNKAANDKLEEKKKEAKEKKERQEKIEKDVLGLDEFTPPPVPPPTKTSGLEILSFASASIAKEKAGEDDNQIVTPPLDKEVTIDVDQPNDKVQGSTKRKNSRLVEGGDAKKPSSVKNTLKFRSMDMINTFDKVLPSLERSAAGFSQALAAKVCPKMKRVKLLRELVQLKQELSSIGENTDGITKEIKSLLEQED